MPLVTRPATCWVRTSTSIPIKLPSAIRLAFNVLRRRLSSSGAFLHALFGFWLCAALTAAAAHAGDDAAIRIVGCADPVQSHKRGICANHLDAPDFAALAPGVSWWYNWFYRPEQAAPSGVAIEFLPMAWGDRPGDLSGLEAYLAAGHKPRAVLAINEPNLRGQAFIPPRQTAELYAKIKDIADKYGIPVVGPHMSLGSAKPDSITALDPLTNQQTTYGFMVPFLKAFLYYAGKTDVPCIAFHTYGNIGELHWAVGMLHKEFNRPIWVTEFAQWKSADESDERKYLIRATDFLERSPEVVGYSWFKERVDKNKTISLFTDKPGELTTLGQAYVAMPVHDHDVYYRVPGQLAAGRYAALQDAEVQPLPREEGLLDMVSTKAGAWLDYNIQVDAAGSYQVVLTAGGKPGKIDLMQNGDLLASVDSGGDSSAALKIFARLSAGAQTIRLRVAAADQTIHSITFTKD